MPPGQHPAGERAHAAAGAGPIGTPPDLTRFGRIPILSEFALRLRDCSLRLDSACLVAPEPEKPTPPSVSRRMFVLTALGSLGLGGVAGFAMGLAETPQQPGLRTDPTVNEGGVIVVTVTAKVSHLYVKLPGRPAARVPVVNGRVEYGLPPQVRGGSVIHISDLRLPNPSSAEVLVVGAQGS